jgi:polyhydroxybutyrate depolymerase
MVTTPVAAWVIKYRRLPVESKLYTMIHDGQKREYRLYIPPNLDPQQPVPLVLALHGGGGTADGMEKLTYSGFHELAERDGFIVAYPQAIDRSWNDGRDKDDSATREEVDDLGFIAALIDEIDAQHHPIDRARVYSTGISNGGFMSLTLACDLADQITAVAIVAASLPEYQAPLCHPARPVPILILDGTKDPLVRWEGGAIQILRKTRGSVLSVAETVTRWQALNGCPAGPQLERLPDTDPGDGTRVRRELYAPCEDGAVIDLYVIEGGGHTWPGGYSYLPAWIVGRTTRDLDAEPVIWDFFKAHALN